MGALGDVDVDELSVRADDAVLAGSWWRPARPHGVVVMLPGSGPSTRDNDTYFPVVRPHLLAAGFAVASFDKRGAGASTGAFVDATIERQADDAAAAVAVVRDLSPDTPVAVFGHSQGGWVAFEAAARDRSLAAAVSNAGPAVGVAEQERFRLVGTLDRSVHADRHAIFDELVRVAAEGCGYDEALAVVADWPALADDLDADSADLWPLFEALCAHDPTRAIERLGVPTLCVYGSRDRVVPVAACVHRLDRIANPVVDVAVIPGGDHRLLVGDGRLAPGYVEVVTDFLARSILGS